MITVACVYWKGKFRIRERIFDETWVEKLSNMVSRNMSSDYKFVCLSNTDVPCETIPLVNNFPGYWSKLELFRPDLFTGRVLYLDLDVLILKDLMPIIDFDGSFIMSSTTGGGKIKEGKHMLNQHNSSVMVWDAGVPDYLYTKFMANPDFWMQYYFGDQDFISGEALTIKKLPMAWAKKLKNCPDFIPTEEMIVAYCQIGKDYLYKNKAIVEEF